MGIGDEVVDDDQGILISVDDFIKCHYLVTFSFFWVDYYIMSLLYGLLLFDLCLFDLDEDVQRSNCKKGMWA